MIINGIVPDIKAPNTGVSVTFTVLSFFLSPSVPRVAETAGSVVKNALLMKISAREAETSQEREDGPKLIT